MGDLSPISYISHDNCFVGRVTHRAGALDTHNYYESILSTMLPRAARCAINPLVRV